MKNNMAGGRDDDGSSIAEFAEEPGSVPKRGEEGSSADTSRRTLP